MNYKDNIISAFSESACRIISGKVVRSLQKMTNCMMSGDDTPLNNIWDEICVQVQCEQSWMWDAYLDTISDYILIEVEKLDNHTKEAIWLQTEEGSDWEWEIEGDGEADSVDSVDFIEYDIVNHILYNFVLPTAANWTNKRIEKYLER